MPDKRKSFEDLDVFKRAYKVSLEVHKISKTFPSDEQFSLADQIRRASKSVCANICEGFAKQIGSKREFKRYVLISLASSDEVRMWLRYSFDLGYIKKDQWQKLRDEYQEISKMLHGLYKSLK